MRPFANLKIGLQYVAYTMFNGGTRKLRWLWAKCQRQQHGLPLCLDGFLAHKSRPFGRLLLADKGGREKLLGKTLPICGTSRGSKAKNWC